MNHIMDALPKFKQIIDKLESIKLAVVEKSEIEYTSQDARILALDSLQISISAVVMWISANNSLANNFTKDEIFDKDNFLISVGSGTDIKQTEEIMFNHLKFGFMTLTHFKIDNLFQNILKHLNTLLNNKGYYNLTDEILKQCSLQKKGTEKDILTAFANLRNSLHCNGIHKNDNLSITIDGTKFDFIKRKRVECASWEDIILLFSSNVDILGKILLSQKVINIKTEIEDDFASGK